MPRHNSKSKAFAKNQKHQQRKIHQERTNQAQRTLEQQRDHWNSARFNLNNQPINPELYLFFMLSLIIKKTNANPIKTQPHQSPSPFHTTPFDTESNNQNELMYAYGFSQLNSDAKSRTSSEKIAKDDIKTQKQSSATENTQLLFSQILNNKMTETQFEEFITAHPKVIDFRDQDGNTLLHHFARDESKSNFIRALLKAGADTVTTNNKFETPIQTALDHFTPNNILAFVENRSAEYYQQVFPLVINHKAPVKLPVLAIIGFAAQHNANELHTIQLLNRINNKTPYDPTLDPDFEFAYYIFNYALEQKNIIFHYGY